MKDILYRKADLLIGKSDKILLVTHANPDGDALASVCAMAEYLSGLPKPYLIYCHDQPLSKFDYLPHFHEFNFRFSLQKDENKDLDLKFDSFDLILVFDCGSLGRTQLAGKIAGRGKGQKVIEFDHHPKTDDYADLELRDPNAASTTEIVYEFFKANKVKVNKEMAKAILTGISTDTANFLHPVTTTKTINIASEMMRKGASLPKIVVRTWRDKSIKSMKIWGRVMSSVRVNKKYNLAFTALTHEDIEELRVDDEVLEGITNFLSSLKGVKGVLFLREKKRGVIRGSLRTADPEIDISKLAKLFGGGGHPKASGFTVEGNLIETDNGWKVV